MNTLSFRSLSMLFNYYRRPILTLMAITGAGIALAVLSKLLPWQLSFLGTRTVLMLVLIFSPLAFRRDAGKHDIDAMLPTTTATRYVVMLLTCFIVIPVLIYLTWYFCGIGVFDDNIRAIKTVFTNVDDLPFWTGVIDELSNILLTGLVMITVIRCRRHVVRNSILAVIGAVLGFSILLGIAMALLFEGDSGLVIMSSIFENVINFAILTAVLLVAELVTIGCLLKKYRL